MESLKGFFESGGRYQYGEGEMEWTFGGSKGVFCFCLNFVLG
jgi:hypothetical protein